MKLLVALEKMTTEEKIEAMEALWSSLCLNAENIPSPEWHGNLLRKRETAMVEGSADFVDWSKAKKQVRDMIE